MTRSWITAQEGNIVYITHRLSEKDPGQRGIRGMVYEGNCYDIKVLSDNQNDPTLCLELIDEDLMLDLKVIPEYEQGVLEKKIAEYCRAHTNENKGGKMSVQIDVALSFSRYRP